MYLYCKHIYASLQHSQLNEQYASLKVVVEESVNLKVRVDQLQDIKRSVRELRRQYGHRLVDQKEFSQDPLNESMAELHRVSLFVALLCLTQFTDNPIWWSTMLCCLNEQHGVVVVYKGFVPVTNAWHRQLTKCLQVLMCEWLHSTNVIWLCMIVIAS